MNPIEIIDKLIDKYSQLSDTEVIDILVQTSPLPDEDDKYWDKDESWYEAYKLEALCRVASLKKIKVAISIILSKMSYGDPGEMMRSFCHGFEYIVEPNYEQLKPIYIESLNSNRPGTRMWAIFCLARLEDPSVINLLNNFLSDEFEQVKDNAESAIEKLSGQT